MYRIDCIYNLEKQIWYKNVAYKGTESWDNDEVAVIEIADISTGVKRAVDAVELFNLASNNEILGAYWTEDYLVLGVVSERAAYLWDTVTFEEEISFDSILDRCRSCPDNYVRLWGYILHSRSANKICGFDSVCADSKFVYCTNCIKLVSNTPYNSLHFCQLVYSKSLDITCNIIDLYFLLPRYFLLLDNSLYFVAPDRNVYQNNAIYKWKLGYKFMLEVI